MDDDDRFSRARPDKAMRHSRPKPYERPSSGRQAKDGIFKRLSDVFTAVPSWLKEKLSPIKVSNGTTSTDSEVDANHIITHDTVDTRTASREQTSERSDVFHTPPSAARSSEEQAGDSEAEDNGSTSTSASSSMLGEGELQDSQISSLAAPLNASVQSVGSSRPRTMFKTLDLSRKRRTDINESAESSVNVSRSPSVYTEDSELGGSLNLGTKRARLNLSTATLPGMSRDSSFSRLSKEDIFQSPFYPGKTTYGGASAYRFDASRPFRTQVISVKSRVKPAEKPRPMTAMTKRIYEALESLAPPPSLDTPKKQLQTPSTSASITGLFTGFSTVNKTPGPPVKALQTPTPARVTFPPLRPIKETPKAIEQPVPTSTPAASKTPAFGGKMVTKVSEVRKRAALGERMEKRKVELEEEPPEVPDLPQISLPEMQLKPISLDVVEKAPPTKVSPVKSEFGFSPAEVLVAGRLAECENVNFSFDAAVDLLVAPKKTISKWECPSCMVRNDDSKSVCPCCSTPKPVKATPTSAHVGPVPKSDAQKSQGTVVKEQMWTCKECLTSHSVEKKQCPVCASPKEKATVPASAPLSILDMFKPKPGSWRCSVCDVSNEAGKSKCCSCASPRTEPSSAKTESALKQAEPPSKPATALPPLSSIVSLKPKSGTWTCSECFVSNQPDSNKCCACSTLKPGSGPAPSSAPAPAPTTGVPLSELFKPKAGSWKCNVCDVSNDSSKVACVACATPKPGEKAPVATETLKFGAAEGTGFKFGVVGEKTDSSGFKLTTTDKTVGTGFKFGVTSSQAPVSGTGFQFGVSTKPQEAVSKPQDVATFKFGAAPEVSLKRKVEEKPLEAEALSDKNANILKKPGLKRPDLSAAVEAPVFAKKSEPPAVFSFGLPKPSSEPDFKKTTAPEGTPAAEPPRSKELETAKAAEADSSVSKVGAVGAPALFQFGSAGSLPAAPTVSFAPRTDTEQAEKQVPKEAPLAFSFAPVASTAAEAKAAESVKPTISFTPVSKPEVASSPFVLGTTAGSSLFGAQVPAASTAAPVTTPAPLFGSAPTTKPDFGMPSATAAPAFGSGFAFGATPATTEAPVFGATSQPAVFATAVTTQASVFAPTTTQTFSFGTSTTTQPSVFGGAATSQTPLFGSAPAQPNLFGSTAGATQPTTFGAPAQSSVFGTAPAVTQASLFGSATAVTQAPAFGAPTSQPSVFGSGVFGSTAATTSAPSSSVFTFGGSTSFGATSTPAPAFGGGAAPGAQASQPLFGSQAPFSSSFGTATTTSASTFGTQSVFGTSQPAPAFGVQPAPAFGAAPTQATPFGTAGSTNQGFSFQPPSTGLNFAFGSQQTSQPPAFGTTPSASSVFGSSSTPSFGTSAAPAFGATPTGSSPFVFGAQAQAPSGQPFGFGQTGPASDSQPAPFSFGASQTTAAAPANPFDAAASRPGPQGRVIRKANRRIQRP